MVLASRCNAGGRSDPEKSETAPSHCLFGVAFADSRRALAASASLAFGLS